MLGRKAVFSCALMFGSVFASSAMWAGTNDLPVAQTGNGNKPPVTRIVGGEPVPFFVPWAVLTSSSRRSCSGSAINKHTIVTAGHCVSGDTVTVYYSTSDRNHPGVRQWTSSWVDVAPRSDVAIVHLSSPNKLSSYASIDLNYAPALGTLGTIRGYGGHGSYPTSDKDALYQASVSISERGTDLLDGPVIKVKGITGSPYSGDSGGPLIVDGKVVGVCVGGPVDPAIDNPSIYADLNALKDWFNQHMGLAIQSVSGSFHGSGDYFPSQRYVTVSGYASPGSTVEVSLDYGVNPVNVKPAPSGQWTHTFDVDSKLASTAKARLIDSDGDELWTDESHIYYH